MFKRKLVKPIKIYIDMRMNDIDTKPMEWANEWGSMQAPTRAEDGSQSKIMNGKKSAMKYRREKELNNFPTKNLLAGIVV